MVTVLFAKQLFAKQQTNKQTYDVERTTPVPVAVSNQAIHDHRICNVWQAKIHPWSVPSAGCWNRDPHIYPAGVLLLPEGTSFMRT